MLIGLLQCGHFASGPGFPEKTYTELYSSLLAGHGFRFRTWSVVDMEFPDAANAADGWLLSGSSHGAYEDKPFIPPLENFIRTAYSARIPMVGLCFGHQIMAQALGGQVEKYAHGWSVGATEYQIGGARMVLNAWHQDQVMVPPEGAEVIATSERCFYAGLAYPERAMSFQPHPEFGRDEIDLLLQIRAPGVVPPDQIAAAQKNQGAPLANKVIADRIAGFFRATENPPRGTEH